MDIWPLGQYEGYANCFEGLTMRSEFQDDRLFVRTAKSYRMTVSYAVRFLTVHRRMVLQHRNPPKIFCLMLGLTPEEPSIDCYCSESGSIYPAPMKPCFPTIPTPAFSRYLRIADFCSPASGSVRPGKQLFEPTPCIGELAGSKP